MAISSSISSSSSDNEVRSSDEETTLANDRFSKADGYHAIPPPITGNFLTPRADISFAGLDEYAIRKKIIESKTTEINTDTSKSKTSETVGKTNEVNMEKPKSVHESVVPKQKINRDKVIIEDWYSDDEDDVSEVNTVSPVKTNVIQTVKTQVDKIGQTSQKEGIGFKKIKACFVCKSTDHLIKDCNFYAKKSPEPKLKSVPILVKGTGLVNPVRPNGKRAVHTVSTARPISTARPFAPKIAQTGSAIRPIYPRMDNVRPRASYLPIKRSYYTKPAFRPKNLKQDVKTSRVKNMTTAGTRAVVNTGKGKMDNALKKSRWVWRPKGNYMDHESKEKGSFILKKFEYVDPKGISKSVDHAVVDSGCSSHMTGNKAYLSDYEDYNGGFVAFRSDPKGGKITGKGKIRTANLDFDDVYFVDELNFKLLDENQVVLRAPRQNGVYILDLKNIVPFGGITCLYANATTDESKLWHRRLGHVNFKNINKLVKGHLVRGLPSKVFMNDHTCVACKKGKQLRPPELSVLCTNLSNRVLALESIKDAQAAEISALKSRIKKLEKKCKPSISHHKAWLKSVKRLSMKKRFGQKESVSKQGRKKSKPESTLDDSTIFDDQDHGMEYMETKEAMDEGRQSGETEEVKLTDDTEVVEDKKAGGDKGEMRLKELEETEEAMDEGRQSGETEEVKLTDDIEVIKDKGSGDKGGNAEELVSTARPEVDITMAQTLIKMKEEKAKEKGVSIKDVDDSSRPARSILTLKPLPTIDPKDKGKRVLKESPVKKVKKSDLDAAQIAKDA
ncbi:putative ribonuclease H-like domain-containing protein [Tanacetum coccineum]|uniref:Ribonuclease H-like domain-containing protein n=1 Tax=Tanacetum coccineum TaxID=301880 RepID=A0ABQ4WVJ6_9ASTR